MHMSMSKKNCIAIAAMIQKRFANTEAWRIEGNRTIELFVEELADYMAWDNPNFDRHRFLKACGF